MEGSVCFIPYESNLSSVAKDTEQNLDVRIERRRMELDRNQKRLQTLKKVRPAFMEEFDKLEVELRSLYDDYLQKFRYVAYLEHLYEDSVKAEQERFERRCVHFTQSLVMSHQLRDEHFKLDFRDLGVAYLFL